MKVGVLLEDDRVNSIKTLLDAFDKYPMIIFELAAEWGFITDLPLDITQQQLDKLIKLSFTAGSYETIEWAKIHTNMLIYQNHNKQRAHNYILSNHNLRPNELISTWSQFVERIGNLEEVNSDFEE